MVKINFSEILFCIFHVYTRVGSVADFPFWYPTIVIRYQFQDTEIDCILAYPQSNRPTNQKKDSKKKKSFQFSERNQYKSAKIYKSMGLKFAISSDLRFVSNTSRFLTILYTDI